MRCLFWTIPKGVMSSCKFWMGKLVSFPGFTNLFSSLQLFDHGSLALRVARKENYSLAGSRWPNTSTHFGKAHYPAFGSIWGCCWESPVVFETVAVGCPMTYDGRNHPQSSQSRVSCHPTLPGMPPTPNRLESWHIQRCPSKWHFTSYPKIVSLPSQHC